MAPKSPLVTTKHQFGSMRRHVASIHKLAECQHFHFPSVELGPVEVKVLQVEQVLPTINDVTVALLVQSNGTAWKVKRTLAENFEFDRQLHRCVFDRRYSRLEELECVCELRNCQETLTTYFNRFSQLTGSVITCYPVLKFLEIDSRGHRFCPAEQSAINTPAIAAALVTKDFQGRGPEQLTIRVGDILSIIEMSSTTPSGSTWWKAKLTIPVSKENNSIDQEDQENGNCQVFQIGYFPSDCVTLFDDKAIPAPSPLATKRLPLTAAKRVGELLRKKVRRKEPIFGVELVAHLQRTGRNVPMILQRCVEAIEKHGIVTGIYRQCGIQSNIQRLRAKFDCGLEPNLSEFAIVRDIYSVSSLLKQYFRQLPNPLFTFQLYDQLIAAGEQKDEATKVECLRDVLQRLVPEHYRTARYLICHLARLCEQRELTDMSSRNLAIVWAPNLFRAPPSLTDGGDSHLLSGLNVHTALCNFMITHANDLFPEEQENDAFPEDLASRTLFEMPSDSSLGTLSSKQTNGFQSLSDEKGASRWSRFIRGASVEQLIGGLARRSTSTVCDPSTATVDASDSEAIKWRRSRSTDAALRQSRSESLLSIWHRGAEGFRDGVSRLAGRARSLRPTRTSTIESKMNDSTVSTMSRLTSDTHENSASKSPSILRRYSHRDRNGSIRKTSDGKAPDSPRKAVYFHNDVSETEEEEAAAAELEEVAVPAAAPVAASLTAVPTTSVEADDVTAPPLAERSSPVEEWSSDEGASSRSSSPMLEMSRYDNVTPTKDFKFTIRKNIFPTIDEHS